jgi:hypothetical protein
MKITRTSLVIAAAAVGLIATTGPAQADPLPMKPQVLHLPGTDTAGDDGYCPFAVTIKYFSNQQTTETVLPDGSTAYRFTGHAKAIVINDATGESISYNISGPGTQTVHPNGSFTIDAAGPNLLWTSVENTEPVGVLPLAYTTGRVRLSVDKDGQTTSYRLNGRSTDVCAELSS